VDGNVGRHQKDGWRDAHERCKLAPFLQLETIHGQHVYKYVAVNSKDALAHDAYSLTVCGRDPDETPPVYCQVSDSDDASSDDLALFMYIDLKSGAWSVSNRMHMKQRGLHSMKQCSSKPVVAGTLPQEAKGWRDRAVVCTSKPVTLHEIGVSDSQLVIDCTNMAGNKLATGLKLPLDVTVESAHEQIASILQKNDPGCNFSLVLESAEMLQQVMKNRPGTRFAHLFREACRNLDCPEACVNISTSSLRCRSASQS